MEDLSYHILDIVENSIRAQAKNIEIVIEEDRKSNVLKLKIHDDGIGIEKNMMKTVCDPFVTTKPNKKVGLGVSLLKQSAREAEGELVIASGREDGTSVCATFQYDHIDRKPMGDMKATLITLLAANPELNIKFIHKKDGKSFMLDTKEIKGQLGNIGINEPDVLRSIKTLLDEEYYYLMIRE